MVLSSITSSSTSSIYALISKDRKSHANVSPEKNLANPIKSSQSEGIGSEESQRIDQVVQKLKQQEEKIKAHEAAHKSAGGQYASAATYTYTPGPDGRSYITGGEVQIDISEGRTPEETTNKMQIVQRAALAPSDPSGQDRAVAAQAAAIAAEAQRKKSEGNDSSKTITPDNGAEKISDPGNQSAVSEISANSSGSIAQKDSRNQFSIYSVQDNSAGRILSFYS